MPFLLANLKTLSLHSVRSIMWSLVGISRSVFSEEPARIHSIALLRLLQAQIRLPNIPFTAGETEWPLVTHDWLHMSLMPDFTADSPPQD
ncbi:hypothetical protein TrVGV298_002852 [Trichoderma virens]|nr:hypothetical protein TrVGV298_002852 [Trichoderma virens]